MQYYVYALQSMKDQDLYIGITNNLERRIQEHNSGQNKSTKSRTPFRLIHQEKCASRIDARNREKYFKSGCGREFVKSFIPR